MLLSIYIRQKNLAEECIFEPDDPYTDKYNTDPSDTYFTNIVRDVIYGDPIILLLAPNNTLFIPDYRREIYYIYETV